MLFSIIFKIYLVSRWKYVFKYFQIKCNGNVEVYMVGIGSRKEKFGQTKFNCKYISFIYFLSPLVLPSYYKFFYLSSSKLSSKKTNNCKENNNLLISIKSFKNKKLYVTLLQIHSFHKIVFYVN